MKIFSFFSSFSVCKGYIYNNVGKSGISINHRITKKKGSTPQRDFSYYGVPPIVYGVLHSVISGSDRSKLDSLLKYLMKFKYGVSLNSLTIALFIALLFLIKYSSKVPSGSTL